MITHYYLTAQQLINKYMLVLTIKEYNEQVKEFYPQDWAQSSKPNGFMAVSDDFAYASWGKTKQSAINKFNNYNIKFK